MTEKPKCVKQVGRPGLAFYRTRQCTNNASVERGGQPYCGVHDPERKKKAEQRYNEWYEERRVAQRRCDQASNRIAVLVRKHPDFAELVKEADAADSALRDIETRKPVRQ